jgi:hypothetical protein
MRLRTGNDFIQRTRHCRAGPSTVPFFGDVHDVKTFNVVQGVIPISVMVSMEQAKRCPMAAHLICCDG